MPDLLLSGLHHRTGDILKGYQTALKFEVVTRQADQLSARLLRELHHGVTVLPARGMYSDTPRNLLICVVNRSQIARFQEILREFPDAFAYVSTVNETVGNFKQVASRTETEDGIHREIRLPRRSRRRDRWQKNPLPGGAPAGDFLICTIN